MDTAPPNILQTSRSDSDVNRKITSQYIYGGTRRSKKTKTPQALDDALTWRPRDSLILDNERAPWNWYKPSSLMLTRAARVIFKRQTISFMDLPAEVRNHIYECSVVHDEHLRINEDKPTNLSTTSPFSMLNKQTRREYISSLDIQARHIHAVVKDFNFSHIYKFYEHLFRTNPRPEGHRLNEAYYDRALIIHLTFSSGYRGKPSDLLLSEWMDQSERISNIAFEEYDILLPVVYELGPRARANWRHREAWLRWWRKEHSRHCDDGDDFFQIVKTLYGKGVGVAWTLPPGWD